MKLFIFVLLALIAAVASNPVKFSVTEDERNAKIIMENARVNFKCGWPDIGYGIPPIDPFLMDNFELNQIQSGINTTTILENTYMYNLRNFNTEIFTFHEDRRIEYKFSVAHLYMNGTHTTRGTMIGIPVVNGNGDFFSNMYNSVYHGYVRWSTHPGTEYMYVTDHDVTIYIEHMTMRMEGFGAITEIVNNQINEQIPEMITSEDFQQQMNDMLKGFLIPIFDSFMYENTPLTIGDTLAYFAANPSPPRC